MASRLKRDDKSNATWSPAQTYMMASICLLLGIAIGYLVRGSGQASAMPGVTTNSAMSASTAQAGQDEAARAQGVPSLDQMRKMADKRVAPLLAKASSEPNNANLLIEIGDNYKAAHQFEQAAEYYDKSLRIDPKNVGVRVDLASCYYYLGNADKSIDELQEALKYDPRHAGALLNLGVIRWKGKMDADGAIASWRQLLKLYPDYEKRAVIEKLMAEAQAYKELPPAERAARSAGPGSSW